MKSKHGKHPKRSRTALRIVRHYYPEVARVVDAKRDVLFQVTADDCKKGTKKAANMCALARAAQHTYDGAIISVGASYLVQGKTAQRYYTPESVQREIVSFDRNQDFAPGMYGLKAPSRSQQLATKLAYQRAYMAKKRAKGKGKYPVRKHRHHTAGIRALPTS